MVHSRWLAGSPRVTLIPSAPGLAPRIGLGPSGPNNVPDYRFVEGFHINPAVNPARSGKPAH